MRTARINGTAPTTMLHSALSILVFAGLFLFLLPEAVFSQGETTSAIVGQVNDASGAAVPGATVTVTNKETGLRRSASTDNSGRFNFPQLKPGAYSVKVEADGFELLQNDAVSAGLGQKQTVDFRLKIAQSQQTVEISSEAPILNPENANTSTTLNARALEDLPNPGGDLTYPLQFAAGALINTSGRSNDFIGGTNGFGNVEFNGLAAVSNGYIVGGLESNDPLTNLNSGLSTNLVLGLNSVSEVTVNTLSYAVDQGRYGASQAAAWLDYIRGRTRRRQIWKAHVRSTEAQLPKQGSLDEKVLLQLWTLSPRQFESVIVGMFREMKTVEHSITQTRYVNDSGFDFFGTFTLPLPVGYEIPFRGEVKRWKQGVGVGEVSRLVARLKRGEYGIFVTTSHYTRQAQHEVVEDGYAVKLLAGVDLVRFLRELKLVAGERLKEEWLAAASGAVPATTA